jgi:25S rRNA (adenine2142-N1)-methyltransferase
MTAKRKHFKRPSLLSNSRSPLIKNARAPSLSSKATRSLIRAHHQLLKAREQAVAAGNSELVNSIDAQITANGGLKSYQLASKTGQSLERGGDSSTVLVDWIRPLLTQLRGSSCKLRVLEVGALSTKNACSKDPSLDVTRIDLHSQEPGILQQDFMERPLPTSYEQRFHLISLSLVLNYVTSPSRRGDMLKRCTAFLTNVLPPESPLTDFAPCLFLVLPAACIANSRYLTQQRLQDIMKSLGFTLLKDRVTVKLIFQLWEYDGSSSHGDNKRFRKEILNPGKSRNNFSITINDTMPPMVINR